METKENKTLIYLWEILLLAIIALGAYAAIQIFAQGHGILEISSETPWGPVILGLRWGLLISTYVFFVLLSTGMCIISSLGYVFGVKEYRLVGKNAVFLSVVMLATGYLPLLVHLGHPERLINFITTPNFSSSIWLMGFFYFFYFVFIVAEFKLLLKGNAKMVKISGAVAVASILAATTLGTVFSRVEVVPLWYGSYYPLYFILSAIISGAAVLMLATILTYKVRKVEMDARLQAFLTGQFRKLFAFVLVLGILFVVWRAAASVRQVETYAAMLLLISGPFSLRFWGLQIFAGAVIPLLMLMHPDTKKSLSGLSIASLLVIIGAYSARYDWIVAPQVIPAVSLLEGLRYYVPPSLEIYVVAGAFAFCLLAYTLGVRRFHLEAKEE